MRFTLHRGEGRYAKWSGVGAALAMLHVARQAACLALVMQKFARNTELARQRQHSLPASSRLIAAKLKGVGDVLNVILSVIGHRPR
ncbi:hypothetical protein B5V02_28610 [Mesorhizobium kowhaii]|uniref:Transposase n=1 Tax=Mesorhizobium kowhaii TaxID=1300272 RepID=A0A2W7BZS6_9HYPH|nr:hypothetical protein B5V02_28610 [Mesorhizobium kowhaii]